MCFITFPCESNGSVQYIKEKGPFDGLLGFSQGACMLHLLLAKMELGEVEISKVITLNSI